MAKKCVHKGCGKRYEADDEECRYHPGPPEFHEGQKGWKCCKPRVLTFDEFLSIPPCTTGTHSNVEEGTAAADTFSKESREAVAGDLPAAPAPVEPPPRLPRPEPAPRATPSPAPPAESDSDDPSIEVKAGQMCRRRGCGAAYDPSSAKGQEQCIHHPGAPIFHEGSKGYLCCKRRVLEFSEFLRIEGCQTKNRHLFVGSGRKAASEDEQILETVRHDFYQTATSLIASLYLKKIDKNTSTVEIDTTSIRVALRTSDRKRYDTSIPLYGSIKPDQSSYKIMGTKLEFNLVKADGAGWPVFRADERITGEIIQTGKAGTVQR